MNTELPEPQRKGASQGAGSTSVREPYWSDDFVTLYLGDCREVLGDIEQDIDQPILVVTDPPYGETSLEWDVRPSDWLQYISTDSVWCFGSLRMFMAAAPEWATAGYKLSQEVVWEKHNGSNFHADRFRRVHELAAHFYKGPWSEIYADPPKTMDATKRTVRRKERPPHTGEIADSTFTSEDGGPRLMRSVIYCRSAHGNAVHPTQKPEGIIRPLIEYGSWEGMVVLDPFAGSGSTGIAARQLGRRAVLIEKNEKYAEAAALRLSQTAMEVAV